MDFNFKSKFRDVDIFEPTNLVDWEVQYENLNRNRQHLTSLYRKSVGNTGSKPQEEDNSDIYKKIPFYSDEDIKTIKYIIGMLRGYLDNNYGIQENRVSGDAFWEWLFFSHPRYWEDYQDHYFHQIRTAYIGSFLLTSDDFRLENNKLFKNVILENFGSVAKKYFDLDKTKKEFKILLFEAWYLSSFFHDAGYPFIIYNTIRSDLFNNIRRLLNNSFGFFVYGGKQRKNLVNKKNIKNYFFKQSIMKRYIEEKPDLGAHLEKLFEEIPETHKQIDYYMIKSKKKKKLHGLFAALNLLTCYDEWVFDPARNDMKEIDFVFNIACEAILRHDKPNSDHCLECEPLAFLLHLTDEIQRSGRHNALWNSKKYPVSLEKFVKIPSMNIDFSSDNKKQVLRVNYELENSLSDERKKRISGKIREDINDLKDRLNLPKSGFDISVNFA